MHQPAPPFSVAFAAISGLARMSPASGEYLEKDSEQKIMKKGAQMRCGVKQKGHTDSDKEQIKLQNK